ncbi:tail fiber domain-containing protein [Pantoea sp. At-9b]|uniref:tail fiber domain-containing protein n=1 Tax=Pantoea sp. (strain At-9b) TaxID=592316 RepID=UPI0001B3F1CC|nr:tail fiber domain-containing protein [Pantoea sp. At-9b]ADU69418.1 conserved hypothetical protein [Pantoea sp. At-9b]
MPAGTITLTNGSTAVTGSGTAFTTDVAVNGFIVASVGGTAYTLGISAITSNTALTLTQAYTGPTTSGVSFDYVPLATLNLITSALASQVTYAIRGLNLDKANWQQIFSGTGNVTVTLPDGTTWTGPAWNGISTTLAGKMDKSGGTFTGAINGNSLSFAGGAFSDNVTGATIQATSTLRCGDYTNSQNYVTTGSGVIEMYAAQPFIDFHYGNSALDYTSRIISDGSYQITVNFASSLTTGGGMFRVNNGGYCCKAGSTGAFASYVYNMNWVNPGSGSQMALYVGTTNTGYITTTSTSDRQLKKDITYLESSAPDDTLAEVLKWKVASFRYKARGIIEESIEKLGFIANDLVEVSPQTVTGNGLPEDYDIEADPNGIGDAYALDQVALIAKLTMAVQAQQQLISAQSEAITTLENRLAALEVTGS